MRLVIVICTSAFLLLLSASCRCNDYARRSIPAVRAETAPVIDGVLDDPVWQQLPSAGDFRDEATNAITADPCTAWIGYDDEFVYAAFHAIDSLPGQIVARQTRRGAGFGGDDRVRLRLNPFNTRRDGDENRFTVNPLGTQNTSIVGGRADKQEWEGEWRSAAARTPDGWTAEMAIPWRILLRPPHTGRPVTMGVNFERYHGRLARESYWSNLGPRERSEFDGEWTGVVVPPGNGDSPLSVLGYVFGGYDEGSGVVRSGMDARYLFTPLLTGVATLNPDFSNIEQAVTSIDFTYSERLPAERRPFFLEGSGYYDFPLGYMTPFRSVRIPAFDAGGKFYGRIGRSTDIGLLNASNIGDRSDNVLTVNHEFSPYDLIGMQYVTRSERGLDNRVFAGAGRMRRGDWTLSVGYSRSDDYTGKGEWSVAELDWTSEMWTVEAAVVRTSPGYLPRNGYIAFTGEKGIALEAGYGRQATGGLLGYYEWDIAAYRYDRWDSSFFRDGFSSDIYLRFANNLELSLDYDKGAFQEFDDEYWSIWAGYPAFNQFNNFGLSYARGRRGGHSYEYIGPGFNWRFFDRLQVSASTEIVRLEDSSEQDVLSFQYDLSREHRLGGRLVRVDGKANWYLSYSRSGYGGTEYFLILGNPNSESFSDRLLFKVVRQL